MAFRRDSNYTVTSLSVSGLLHKRDLLPYKRLSKSLCSQVMGQAVSGTLKWEHLVSVLIDHTTWGYWKKQHPETKILSRDRRLRVWLSTFKIRALLRNWGHLFPCILPNQSVPSQRAGNWNKYQCPLQRPPSSGVISSKITTWILGSRPKIFSWI